MTVVKRPGSRQEKKIYHINLLKKWHPTNALATIAIEDEHDVEELETEYLLDTSSMQQKLAPKALSHLSPDQDRTTPRVLRCLQIGRTSVTEYTTEVGDTSPIRQHPYRVPLAMRNIVRKEIGKMLEIGAMKPSSPVLC